MPDDTPKSVLPGEPGPGGPAPGTAPNPATDAANEGAPTGEQPKPEPKEDVGAKFDKLLKDGKSAISETLKKTAKELLGHGRDTVKILLSSSGLSAEDKNLVALTYQSAEKHAVAGRQVQADNMVRRTVNFVRSDALVKKALKVEAAENYLSTVLGILSSAGLGFLSKFGAPLVDDVSELAGDALNDILGS